MSTKGGLKLAAPEDPPTSRINGVTVVRVRSVLDIVEALPESKISSASEGGRAPAARLSSSPAVVVRFSAPDERAAAVLPEGTVVLVVPPDFEGATEPPVTLMPAEEPAAVPRWVWIPSAERSIRYDVIVFRNATMRDVVKAQKENHWGIRKLCWPNLTTASLDKPVLSALFRDNDPRYPQNYYQRSAPMPRDQLRSFTYLPLRARAATDVVETTWTRPAGDQAGGPPPWLDYKLVLKATLRVDPGEAKRQVRRVVLLYDPEVFDRDILDSFWDNYPKALQDEKLDGVDVTVEVLNKPAYVTSLMVIVVTASSTNRRHDQALKALFPKLKRVSQESQLLVDPVDIHQMGTAMGDRYKAFNLPCREFGGIMKVGAAIEEFFKWLKGEVLAASSEENPNLQAFFRLAEDDWEIYANVVVFEAADKGVGGGVASAADAPSTTLETK